MRKALVVGIDHYANKDRLYGCVNDAYSVKSVLERHSDGTRNFDVRQLTATSASDAISRAELRRSVEELFKGDHVETALFYFAGHGCLESTGGYILASDSRTGDEGLSLGDVLTFANSASARNKVIILDSCNSGAAGTRASQHTELSDGLTILTASTAEQYATEENGSGVFTFLLVDGMSGAAANLVGDITPGSVYAHIDQSLGSWEQRPVFKTNVKNFVSLRKVQPAIGLAELQRITTLFPSAGFEFHLDETYEPEGGNPDPVKTEIFAILQKYNRVNLLVPVGAPHMYHAAMEKRSCKLTVLGEHYRRLVEKGRI
jgi:hypothetical protein